MNFNKVLLRQIEFALNDMKEYAAYMEGYIAQSIDDFEQKYSEVEIELLKESDPYYYDWRMDDYIERWQQVGKIYPNSFRSAFFSQIYSIFESKIVSICELHHKMKNTLEALPGKGSTIAKAKRYLINSAGVNFSQLQKDFDYIDRIRVARNSVIHNESMITPINKEWNKVYQLVKQSSGNLTFAHDPDEIQEDGLMRSLSRPKFKFQLLFPDHKMNEKFLETVERFFKNLLSQSVF